MYECEMTQVSIGMARSLDVYTDGCALLAQLLISIVLAAEQLDCAAITLR